MTEEIRSLFAAAGSPLDDRDWAFFERLRERVIEANRTMNLTRLTGPLDFHRKHVLDSALPFRAVPELSGAGERLLAADLGSGAGFPGLVLARLHPRWDVALIERTQKKAAFLEETIEALGIANAYVVPFDAREAAGHAPVLHHGCQLVLARAVGRIAAVTAAAATLLAPGGAIVHYKGGRPAATELEEGARAARRLGLSQVGPRVYPLPPDARRSVVLTISPPSGRTRRGASRRKRARRKSRGGRAR